MSRFVLIADAHVGPEKIYEGQIRKLSRHSLAYLDQLTAQIESEKEADFVVQLGDLIEDSDQAIVDRANFIQARESFDRLSMPVLHVIGNHDQVHLTKNDLASLIGRERLYYSQDAGGLHCVVLFSSSIAHTDIHIDEEQRRWLETDLAAANLPVVVFLHHPLDDQDLKGNVWFEKYPDYCFVEERVEVREILAQSAKVVAVFNGHVHQNRLSQIDQIYYVTVQSLVEKVGEPDLCSRAYTAVSLADEMLDIEVFGNDSVRYKLPIDLKKFCRQAEFAP